MKAHMDVSFYRGKSILVTGSSGFLAANLIDVLRRTRCRIRRLSRDPSRLEPLTGEAVIDDVAADFSDVEVWRHALEGVDIVFHFAAQTSVSVANADPVADHRANVLPMMYMLETCHKENLKTTILFSGTVTEAGFTSRIPVDETHTDEPVTIYDLHKLIAEQYLKYYVRVGSVRGAVLRLSNVYGPGPESRAVGRGVLNGMIRKALSGEKLTIYGDGNNIRDYIYVGDVVRAFLMAGIRIEQVNGKHFVIGSGKGHSIAEAVYLVSERVRSITGRTVPVVHVNPSHSGSPIERRDFIADTTLYTSGTGWSANISLTEGIDQTVEYYCRETGAVL